MLYRRIGQLVLAMMIIAAFAAGCGGRGVSRIQSPELDSPAAGMNTGTGPPASIVSNEGLRKHVEYVYDYAACPAELGIAVVPMAAEDCPATDKFTDYGIAVEERGEGLEARLYASEDSLIYAHLRYDPAEWHVGGVVSHNVWGTERFAAMATIPAPGVVVLASVPAGPPARASDGIDFARVTLNPATGRLASDYLPPGNTAEDGTIWLRQNQTNYEGAVEFRLDGQYGNEDSRSGNLEDNSPEGVNEFGRAAQDHHVHDVVFSIFGDAQRYSTGSWPTEPPTLSFHELMRGDHDNNGYVTVMDLTQIGQYDSVDDEFSYHAARGVQEITGQNPLTAEWRSMMLNLRSRTSPVVEPDWRLTSPTVQAFWYFPHDPPNEPPWYSEDAESPIYDAVDSNWDGYVRDYYNYHDTEITQPGLNSFWNEPERQMYHAGDSAAVARYFDCAITGYEVWSVRTWDYSHAKSGTDLRLDLDSAPSAKRLICYDREVELDPPGNTGTRWDSILGKPITTYPYTERPWVGAPPDYQPEFQKAQLVQEFPTAGSFFADVTEYGQYDIIMIPYFYNDASQILQCGAHTVISDALTNLPPDSTDYYGPVYRWDLVLPPEFEPEPECWGLQDVSYNDSETRLGTSDPQYSFLLNVVNADDLNSAGQFDGSHSLVDYTIYGYYDEEYDGTDPSVVFTAGEQVATIREGNDNGSYYDTEYEKWMVELKLDVDMLSTSLPFDQPGKTIWLSVRANEVDPADPLLEYSTPAGEPQFDPNEQIDFIDIADRSAPYFVRYSDYPEQSYPDNANSSNDRTSFQRGSPKPFEDAIWLKFHPAVDPPTYSMDTPIRYDLYVEFDSFGELPALEERRDSRTLVYSDYFDENGESVYESSGSDPWLSAFRFEITEDPLGHPLQRGDVLHAMVVAYDLSDGVDGNHSPVFASKLIHTLFDIVPPPDVESGLSFDQAAIRGSIRAFGTDLHVLHPTGYPGTGGVRPELTYVRYPNGLPDPAENEPEIISSSSPFDPPPYVAYQLTQTGMDFKLDEFGDYVLDGEGLPVPVIAFSGEPQTGIDPVDLFTAERVGHGNWQLTWHERPEVYNPADFTTGASATAMSSYAGFWIPGPFEEDAPFGEYVVSWIHEPANAPLDFYEHPRGDLWRKARTSSGTPSLWPSGLWPWSSETKAVVVEYAAYAARRVMSPFQSDLRLRDLGRVVHSSAQIGEWGAKGNMLFCLASSPDDAIPYSGADYQWSRIKLLYTGHPDHPQSTWQNLDLKTVLNAFNPNGPEGTLGPNALEVCRTVQSNDDAHVYVAFVNSRVDDSNDSDGQGLMLTKGSYVRGFPVGEISGGWQLPALGGMIDDSYSVDSAYYSYTETAGTCGLVDIRCKPSYRDNGSGAFEGLGCAYVHPEGAIYLAESNGSGSGWERYPVNEDYENVIDVGDILWVKLAYLNDSTPFLLYALRTSTALNAYKVRLWSPLLTP